MTRMIWSFLAAAVFVIGSSDCRECKAQARRKAEPHRATTNRENAKLSTNQVPSLQKILDDMPSNSQPSDSDDDGGTFARGRANEWLKFNLSGRSIEFKVHLADAKFVGGSSDGTYRGHAEFAPVVERFLSIGKVRSGDKDWNIYISIGQRGGGFFGGPATDLLYSNSIISNGVDFQLDENAVKRLRERIGKDITLSGTVSGQNSPETRPHFYLKPRGDKKPEGRLFLHFPGISIIGIDTSKDVHESEKQVSIESIKTDLSSQETDKGPPNVVSSLQKILDNIPKDSQPQDDVDGTVELIKANEWLKSNLVGKPIEFKAHFADAKVSGGGNGKYSVRLEFAQSTPSGLSVGKVRSGGREWNVYININIASSMLVLDEAGVRHVQELRGKDVTVTGTVYQPQNSSSHALLRGSGVLELPRFSVRRDTPGTVRSLHVRLSDAKIKEL